jgi:flagellar protein FlbD
MIRLTRLNGRAFVLNAEQIKTVEQTPDTMITLLRGDQLLVRESLEEVVKRAIEFSRSLRAVQNV